MVCLVSVLLWLSHHQPRYIDGFLLQQHAHTPHANTTTQHATHTTLARATTLTTRHAHIHAQHVRAHTTHTTHTQHSHPYSHTHHPRNIESVFANCNAKLFRETLTSFPNLKQKVCTHTHQTTPKHTCYIHTCMHDTHHTDTDTRTHTDTQKHRHT